MFMYCPRGGGDNLLPSSSSRTLSPYLLCFDLRKLENQDLVPDLIFRFQDLPDSLFIEWAAASQHLLPAALHKCSAVSLATAYSASGYTAATVAAPRTATASLCAVGNEETTLALKVVYVASTRGAYNLGTM